MNSYIALREYGGHKDGCEYIREISNYCTCHYLTQMLADWKVLGHPTDSTQEEFLAGIERSRSV